jgi:hypothetical protein
MARSSWGPSWIHSRKGGKLEASSSETEDTITAERDKKERYILSEKNFGAAQEEFSNIKVEAADPGKVTLEVPVNEINLEKLDEQCSKVFKIKREFKDPNRKPWLEKTKDGKEIEHTALWELIEKHKDKIGLEDFSDGSTYYV